MKNLIHYLDVSKPITTHLVGPNHTVAHHKITGAIIMIIGVGLVKLTYATDVFVIHYLGDIVGFFIHAIGAIPYIKTLEL